MQFDSFSAFLAMGGYGFYVWLSYGVAALLLTILIILSVRKDRAVKKHIAQKQKREQKLRRAAKQQAAQLSNDSEEVVS